MASAAQQAGVRRFVQISSMGAGNPPQPGRDEVWAAYIAAKTAAEADLRSRDLDWTILRPGHLIDDPPAGRVRLAAPPVAVGAISRADVAAVIAALLDQPGTRHQTLELVGADTPVIEAVRSRLQRPASTVRGQRLIIISGEEGAGKSTIARCCHPPRTAPGSTPRTSGRPIPAQFPRSRPKNVSSNVADLVQNFWAAGYINVIAGSFLRSYSDYVSFRQLLTCPSAVFLVDLLVDKEARDHRRITRAKQTTQEWRDMVDQIPEDLTIRQAADADYRYIGIDTTNLNVAGTVQRIQDPLSAISGTRTARAIKDR
jgi:NAD(P)H-binding